MFKKRLRNIAEERAERLQESEDQEFYCKIVSPRNMTEAPFAAVSAAMSMLKLQKRLASSVLW